MLLEDDYTVRADGQRTSVIEKDPLGSTTKFDWLYDELGRLVEEMFDFGDNATADARDYIARYGFDLAGNRIAMAKDAGHVNRATFEADKTETTSYDYDANDRLTSEAKNDLTGTNADRYTVYGYGAGNTATQQTSKDVHAGSSAAGSTLENTTYAYDVRGRMSSATVDATGSSGGVTSSTYAYNDVGTRVKQAVTSGATTTTLYVVDEQSPTGFSQVLEEKTSTGTPTATTLPTRTYALGLDVISQTDAGGGPRFLLYDGHGSTRALVDATGQVLSGQIYAYDAYGNMLTGSGLATAATALTSILYSGEQTDATTGLQYLRARYYDPRNGRFTTFDSFARSRHDPQSLHKYLYVQADPVNGADPSGHEFTLAGLEANIGSTLNLASQGLRAIRSIETAIDALRTVLNIIELLRGDVIGMIRREVAERARDWRALPPHFVTARLFRADFWEDAADVLARQSGPILARIIARQGKDIVNYYNKLPSNQFRWVFYMPSPAEPRIPNLDFRFRLPGLKLLDRDVMLQFGGIGTGRLFGLGFENKRTWQSQFFRMDYHRPHDYPMAPEDNWNVRGDRYDFNFHTPTFKQESIARNGST